METASRSSGGFADDDEIEENELDRREGSSQRGGPSVRADGKSGDQKPGTPSTPRSKHSATEQRRRCKINDRFQILRDLIPHSDQKRDKATFLLEVIEYIRYLQEKVQKDETSQPGWNQENSKLLPWISNQGPGDGNADPTHVIKNGPALPGFMYSGRFDDQCIPVAAAMLSSAQNITESDMCSDIAYKTLETPVPPSKADSLPVPLQPNLYASGAGETNFTEPQQRLHSDSDNLPSQSQSPWLRSSFPGDCTVGSEMNEQEELTIDEGTISVSSAYSHGLLTTLTQTLQSSGVDMSQASISVQINLGKRVTRRPTDTIGMPSDKDHVDPSSVSQMALGSVGKESEQVVKKHKPDDECN